MQLPGGLMRSIAAALLAGSSVSGMPAPEINECSIVSTDIVRADVTLVDPTPDALSVRLVVYCGQAVVTQTGASRNERALKFIDLDVVQAAVLVDAADDLLTDDDVFVED